MNRPTKGIPRIQEGGGTFGSADERIASFSTEIRKAMRYRCEQEGHNWVTSCSQFLVIFQICKWCGETR